MLTLSELFFQSRAWTLSLGFSLAYGAMFSKTWRVHLIFTNKKLKRKVINVVKQTEVQISFSTQALDLKAGFTFLSKNKIA